MNKCQFAQRWLVVNTSDRCFLPASKEATNKEVESTQYPESNSTPGQVPCGGLTHSSPFCPLDGARARGKSRINWPCFPGVPFAEQQAA